MDLKPRIFWVIVPTVDTEQRNDMLVFPCCWENPMISILFLEGWHNPVSYHSEAYEF